MRDENPNFHEMLDPPYEREGTLHWVLIALGLIVAVEGLINIPSDIMAIWHWLFQL